MTPKPGFKYVFAALLAIVSALTLPVMSAANAATCGGVAGTGKVADGTVQARTAEQAKGTFIAADGYWTLCQTEEQTRPATPKDCAGDASFRHWQDQRTGERCTTTNPYAANATNPARDQGIRHGQIGVWRQWEGTQRGTLIESCTDGKRKTLLASCTKVTHCDVLISTQVKGKVYRYDGRGDKRVPLGGSATAVAADGSSIRLQCVGGNFVTR